MSEATVVDKGISDAKLADLVTLHERQRAMHAERNEIKAACAVDDIIAALRELQEMREADRHFTELEHQLIAKAQMFRKERDVLKFSLTASEKRNEEAVRLLRAGGNGGVFCLMAESSDDADVWYDQRDQFLEGK